MTDGWRGESTWWLNIHTVYPMVSVSCHSERELTFFLELSSRALEMPGLSDLAGSRTWGEAGRDSGAPTHLTVYVLLYCNSFP